MYRPFLQNIAKHIQLTTAEEELLLAHLLAKSVVKNQVVVAAGAFCKELYFVTEGCLRIYQTDENGVDANILFCPENWWASDIVSFSGNTPATFSIDAIEDTELICIAARDMESLYLKIPKLERFFRILFQNGFALYQQRLSLVLQATAEKRYELFSRQYPTLVNRISQKHIAAYLGITPVFLSIIRRKRIQPDERE